MTLLSKWLQLPVIIIIIFPHCAMGRIRPVIKALNILKLFNHRSQDLQSRHGFDSFHGKDDSKIFHTLSLGCLACNYSFAFMSRFSQYVTFLTEPDHTTYINLDFHYQMMDTFWQNFTSFPGSFWWQHIPHSRRLSINKIPARALLVEHTWPDPTRVSPRSPQGAVWKTLGTKLFSREHGSDWNTNKCTVITVIIKSCDRPTRLPLFASTTSLPLEFGSHEYVLERFSSFVRDDGGIFVYFTQ